MFKPLGEKLYLDKSPIHGHGIFTTHALVASEFIHISHVDPPEKLNIEEALEFFDSGIVRTASGSYVNHSDCPNAVMVRGKGFWFLKALTDIESHSEVTIDYTNTPCGVNYNLSNFKNCK